MYYNVKRMCIKSSPKREGSRMRDTPVSRKEKMFVIIANRALKKNTMEIE